MEKKIINMTPHQVVVVAKEGEVVKTFPSEGTIRLSMKTVEVGEIGGIRLTKTEYGEPEGLPEDADGVYYIVSAMVKAACPDRHDLLVPAEQVRNTAGQIIGCRSLGI